MKNPSETNATGAIIKNRRELLFIFIQALGLKTCSQSTDCTTRELDRRNARRGLVSTFFFVFFSATREFFFRWKKKKNIFNYRCLDNKLKISTDLLLSNTSREVTSTSVFFFYASHRSFAYSHESRPESESFASVCDERGMELNNSNNNE